MAKVLRLGRLIATLGAIVVCAGEASAQNGRGPGGGGPPGHAAGGGGGPSGGHPGQGVGALRGHSDRGVGLSGGGDFRGRPSIGPQMGGPGSDVSRPRAVSGRNVGGAPIGASRIGRPNVSREFGPGNRGARSAGRPPGLSRQASESPRSGRALGRTDGAGRERTTGRAARDAWEPPGLARRAAAKDRELPATASAPAKAVQGLLPSEPRREQVERLIRNNPALVDVDPFGEPIVRNEILALSPDPSLIAQVRLAGFSASTREFYDKLGLNLVVLKPPPGVSAGEAMRRLRGLDPKGRYDFNHVYQESGVVGLAAAAQSVSTSAGVAANRRVRVGLVDGAVAPDHPTLSRARLVQRAFAPGGARPTAHATAAATLIAGSADGFRGAAPGATVYVADVYGPTAAGGSVSALVRALSWMVEQGVPVINISLVGPPNLLLGEAVRALVGRGHVVVAAVGNDGPAAAALYPAAYPGVVAVTAVDGRMRVLPEAGRGPHVAFAAPGADMAAGALDGGYVAVRGTSFAAPVAAGLLAQLMPKPDAAEAARAVATLGREAKDLGDKGRDPIYGRGLVAFDLRTDPKAMGIQRAALRETRLN